MHCRDRCRVVDHTFERVGQADEPPEPRERDRFELGRRWRRAPQHRLLIERGAQKIREHARRAGGGREVGQKSRMVPVRQPGHEHALEIGHDRVEWLPLFGCVRGKRRHDLSGPDPRQHRIFVGVLEILGDPVDEVVAVAPKGRRVHAGYDLCDLM